MNFNNGATDEDVLSPRGEVQLRKASRYSACRARGHRETWPTCGCGRRGRGVRETDSTNCFALQQKRQGRTLAYADFELVDTGRGHPHGTAHALSRRSFIVLEKTVDGRDMRSQLINKFE